MSDPVVKMSVKGWNLAVKDYFPTPELFNEGEPGKSRSHVCYAGPGITLREHYACEMMKALTMAQSALVDSVEGGEAILAEKAVKMADALIEYIANNEPEREEGVIKP